MDSSLNSSNGYSSENKFISETVSTSVVNCDNFIDGVLRYIDQMMMEEEMDEEQTCMLQESLSFQEKERSFYEVLGKKYPPSSLQESTHDGQYSERPEHDTNYNHYSSTTIGSGFLTDVVDQSVRNSSINGVLDENTKQGKINPENGDVMIRTSHLGKKEEFDDVWVYTLGGRDKELAAYIQDLKISASNKMPQCGVKGKKPNRKEETLDLTSILLNCAQYVAADDRRSADELLRHIRNCSSPFGSGGQRLAHYFANGLEARLAGIGSQVYHALLHKKITDSDYLKAYFTSFISSSFRRVSNFVSNKLIMIKSEKAAKVHIIDFGIFYGFQWPTFIQRVGEREGGSQKIRITGIDFPQLGSRPAERIEDTGCRLARYAKMFNVPFEYTAIAQIWETIKVEDLKIEEGEFVVVNCMYLTKNLLDDSSGMKSSRSVFLALIRKINPDIFIHGVVNGAYNLPLFLSRFREGLFHFSALFDFLETVIPRERPERMIIESLFEKEIVNVIACEGLERVERPETYKQWQLRHLREGFMQLPFERKLMNIVMYKVRKSYHEDFVVDEENNWMLMSWKGRIIYAISCWKLV